MMYVLNVDEASAATGNAHSAEAELYARKRGILSVVISAAIEAEVAQLPAEDQAEYLGHLGLKETGLARVVRAGYQLLDLVTFFTVGPKEVRAWTVRRGARAPEAAGVIHTDFEKGFIRAETVGFDDFVRVGGEAGARTGASPGRRQGLRRQGRRRHPVPFQRLADQPPAPGPVLGAQHLLVDLADGGEG